MWELDDYGQFIVWYIPFLQDNYAYFIVDKRSGYVACVDAADPEFIYKELIVKTLYFQKI